MDLSHIIIDGNCVLVEMFVSSDYKVCCIHYINIGVFPTWGLNDIFLAAK